MSGQLNLTTVKLGDSADTSKNFLISVPTVPDGTLTIERENGTDVLTVDATGKITANCGLGAGQTWQDVLTGRAINTDYTNNTGRSIAVAIRVSVSTTSAYGALKVDNRHVAIYQGYGIGSVGTLFAVVPAGSTYRVEQGGGGTIILTHWEELR